jgi:hypothetical protein
MREERDFLPQRSAGILAGNLEIEAETERRRT